MGKKIERHQNQIKKLKENNKKKKDENTKPSESTHSVLCSSRNKTRNTLQPIDNNQSTNDEDSDVGKPTHKYMLRSASKNRKRGRDLIEKENESKKTSILRNKKNANQQKQVLQSVEPNRKR